jgi:hypothetical protein
MIEYEPPLYVRLPELERDGKRVIRQVGIWPWKGVDFFDAQYMERSANYSEKFQQVGLLHTVESFEECLQWGDTCGR